LKVALSSGVYKKNKPLGSSLAKNALPVLIIIETSGKIHFSSGDIPHRIPLEKLDPNRAGCFLGLFNDEAWSFYPLNNFKKANISDREHLIHDLINFLNIAFLQKTNKDCETNFEGIIEFLQGKNRVNCNYLDSQAIKEVILSYSKIINNSKLRFENWENTLINSSKIQIKRILLNLLTNADQAHKQGNIYGEIIINLRTNIIDRGKKYTVISLKDQGEGISKDKMSKIFQRGFSSRGSSGLGITIVQQILGEVGGFCKYQSEVNNGTEVLLFFPHLAPVKQKRIMILENEPIIARDLVKKLQCLNKNHQIGLFYNLTSARKCNESFDLLFLDGKLPDGRGEAIVPFMKKRNPKIKIINFSAIKSPPSTYYLAKPVRVAHLYSLLMELA
jgi:hypothetical protein